MIDLRPYFKHLHWRPMPHSMGVPVASDWADKADDDPVFGVFKQCGLWAMDEVQILYECAYRMSDIYTGNAWLDIGCHTGWTTRHIAEGLLNVAVLAIDPMLAVPEFDARFRENTGDLAIARYGFTSNEFFDRCKDSAKCSGVCIDGDHSPGKPLEDAINAVKHLADRGVILFHDATGYPVQEAVEYCVAQGFNVKSYVTVHGVVVAWRGEFIPPEYQIDPRCAVVADRLGSLKRFL